MNDEGLTLQRRSGCRSRCRSRCCSRCSAPSRALISLQAPQQFWKCLGGLMGAVVFVTNRCSLISHIRADRLSFMARSSSPAMFRAPRSPAEGQSPAVLSVREASRCRLRLRFSDVSSGVRL